MLEEIAPKHKLRLIDLVSDAGVDVSPWGESKRGKDGAAMNPKFCYDWSYVQPGRVVVLNLWHHAMREGPGGSITLDTNMRAFASQRPEPERSRALKMDAAIQTAIRDDLPIRVVALAGKRRGDANGPAEGPSKVSARLLDTAEWGVEEYDAQTGQCRLRRGLESHLGGDNPFRQPDVDQDAESGVEGRRRWMQHFRRERDPSIVKKKKAKVRAEKGRLACEACNFDFAQFYHPLVQDFCEVHHRKPLSELDEERKTRLEDLAILCSNCHRVIHRVKPMPTDEAFAEMLNGRRNQAPPG